MKIIIKIFLISSLLTLLLSGCFSGANKQVGNSQNKPGENNDDIAHILTQSELGQLEVSIKTGSDVNNKYSAVSSKSTAIGSRLAVTGEFKNHASEQNSTALPDNAKPGECYARVLVPAKYQSITKKIVIHPAKYSIEKTPAQYEWMDERVLVQETFERIKIIPAKYDWETVPVLVKNASVQLKTTPAVYEDQTTKILVKKAYTAWKKGRGPIEKIDNATDEIMCLIEVPAEYKTVTKKVMIKPEKTEKIVTMAVYKKGKRQVLVKPEEKINETVPAEYKTIKVKKVVVPAQQRRIEIPAVYGEAVERIKISDSHNDWRKILCETNTTANVVYKLQSALQEFGYKPGKADGVIGKHTMKAVRSYQQEKGLAVGQITIETLKSLNIIHQ